MFSRRTRISAKGRLSAMRGFDMPYERSVSGLWTAGYVVRSSRRAWAENYVSICWIGS